MENTGKRLSELIKDAEQKGCQVVLIGVDAEIGRHAALIAAMAKKPDVVLVCVKDLPQEDQDMIARLSRPVEPIELKIERLPELPEIVLEKEILSESKQNILQSAKHLAHSLPKNFNRPVRKSFNHRRH